ncbi:MAG: carboxypeptidase-like regulatory domain-containing protein, partial [Thermoplasmata archaeon]|nr:carboxypeptidase-like regulatory domain-containing protein [Thermoplasmata archaeon]
VAVDSSGVQHELEDLTYNMNIVSYEVVYAEMFYNSMFYAAMCGFSGSDIGLEDTGLPGYSGDIQSETPMPGWNMTHFRMVYRTAYYNPYPTAEIPYHSDATIAISYDEALEISEKIANGEMDGYVYAPASAYQSGTVFLEYYHGAYVNGTVTTEEEYPVEGMVVTILDEYGIPHHVTTTNSEGEYSLLAPFGNVTVVISQGSYMTTSLIGTNEIDYVQFNVTDDQAMRVKQDLDGDGILDYIITKDFVMTSTPVSGDIFWDVDKDGNYTVGTDEIIPDVTVVAVDTVSDRVYTFDASEGTYEGTLPPGQYDFTAIVFDKNLTNAAMANVTTGSDFTLNLPIVPGGVAGYASYVDGEPAAGVGLVLSDIASDMQFVTVTDLNGEYLFDRVLEAKFRLQTTEPGLIVFDEKFSVTTYTEARNITVYDKVSISYRATVDGAAAAYASYQVSDDYDASEYLTGSADKYGRIKLDLPVGHFSLYVTYNSGEVTYAGSIAIGASISSTGTLALAQSYRIVGGLLSPSESVV